MAGWGSSIDSVFGIGRKSEQILSIASILLSVHILKSPSTYRVITATEFRSYWRWTFCKWTVRVCEIKFSLYKAWKPLMCNSFSNSTISVHNTDASRFWQLWNPIWKWRWACVKDIFLLTVHHYISENLSKFRKL